MTETCQVCGHPVDMPTPHVTVTRQIETQTGAETTVWDAVVLAYLHLECDVAAAEATDPAGAVA